MSIDKQILCPISGNEYTFKDQSKGFKSHIQGSNCYSYAMNHFEMNGSRNHKSVPGDISRNIKGTSHKFTDWQSCGNAICRILHDGRVAGQNLKLKRPLTKKVVGKTIKKQMSKKSSPGYRKIVLVVEDKAEPPGVPSDFHFYAQNRISVGDFYNQPRVTSLCCGKTVSKNPYELAGINAFETNFKLNKKLKSIPEITSLRNTPTDPYQRALTNIKLHIDMVPKYAVLKFIPDPFWIIDLHADAFDVRMMKAHCDGLRATIRAKKQNGVNNFSATSIRLVNKCCNLCEKIIKGRLREIPKAKLIGLWSHKLGWGTAPLNTDGDGKLIFDPSRANRKHGHYAYGKTCQAFDVLCGWGVSSKHGL